MPFIKVTMIAGYDDATLVRLSERITDSVRSVIAAPADGVIVALDQVEAGNYMRGREMRQPGKALPDAAGQVRSFLEAMENRDLVRARAFLAAGFEMVFPGGARFRKLEDLVGWAKGRYKRVSKTYERFDTAPLDGVVAVYCHGTLSGEWLDGSAFSGIRFIDRFEVSGGLLQSQMVWNDMGEHRA